MQYKIFYLFGHSPRLSNRLEKLSTVILNQRQYGHSVGVALLHDGVLGAAPKGHVPNAVKDILDMGCGVYALKSDLQARGFSDVALEDGIAIIDYSQLIEMIVQSGSLCSWM